jgi:hypothetical protein
MSIAMQRVIFRFKSPSGSGTNQPSPTMHEALMLLSEADELQPLFDDAEKADKFVAIEVFHDRAGTPVLIYFTQEAA